MKLSREVAVGDDRRAAVDAQHRLQPPDVVAGRAALEGPGDVDGHVGVGGVDALGDTEAEPARRVELEHFAVVVDGTGLVRDLTVTVEGHLAVVGAVDRETEILHRLQLRRREHRQPMAGDCDRAGVVPRLRRRRQLARPPRLDRAVAMDEQVVADVRPAIGDVPPPYHLDAVVRRVVGRGAMPEHPVDGPLRLLEDVRQGRLSDEPPSSREREPAVSLPRSGPQRFGLCCGSVCRHFVADGLETLEPSWVECTRSQRLGV